MLGKLKKIKWRRHSVSTSNVAGRLRHSVSTSDVAGRLRQIRWQRHSVSVSDVAERLRKIDRRPRSETLNERRQGIEVLKARGKLLKTFWHICFLKWHWKYCCSGLAIVTIKGLLFLNTFLVRTWRFVAWVPDRAWNKDSRTRSNFTENRQKIAPGPFPCAQIIWEPGAFHHPAGANLLFCTCYFKA